MARIVIVEDNPDAALVMRRVLEKLGGHRAIVTEEAEQVVAWCRAGEVDLVLMDVSLSRSTYQGQPLDGLKLTRLLKGDPRTACVPVLLVTAHAMRGDRERFLAESGADGYVVKPIADLDAFLQTVNEQLSRVPPVPLPSPVSPEPGPPGDPSESRAVLHDLGKLLFSIKASLQLLLEQAGTLQPAPQELLAIALRSTDRLIGLLEGIVGQNGVSRGPAAGSPLTSPFDTLGLLRSLEGMGPGVKRILVADDEPDVVRVLTAILEARGYEVIQAFDGGSVLEQAARAKPDLIILDLDMPGMDGYEVLFHLKRDERLKRVPVVVFTGCAWGEERTARSLGAEGYVSKRSLPGP